MSAILRAFDRYSYVGNDPTNFIDPSGLITCFGYHVWYISYYPDNGQIISVNYGGFIPVYCWEEGVFGGGDSGAGGGGGGPSVEADRSEEPGCDRAAQWELRRQTVVREREIIKEELSINERDLVEAGINAGLCLGGLVAAVLIKIPAAVTAALRSCGLAVGVTLGARIAVSAAKITALNVQRELKEAEMNCGEAGVLKRALEKIGIL